MSLSRMEVYWIRVSGFMRSRCIYCFGTVSVADELLGSCGRITRGWHSLYSWYGLRVVWRWRKAWISVHGNSLIYQDATKEKHVRSKSSGAGKSPGFIILFVGVTRLCSSRLFFETDFTLP